MGDLAPDRMLLHYRLIAPLGRGGMGEVWRAFDTKLEREIAIKILPDSMAGDPERRARLQAEAKAVARLSHPNIIAVHAIEEVDGDRLVAMELVHGRTLGDLIPARGFEVDRFLDLAIPLADAMAAAHRAGVTHRDLKPANVMVTQDGTVKVLDFGLAKLTESAPSDDDHTRVTTETTEPAGKIVGTLAYMSPEQAEGKPVDHRGDVFSLGVIFYEMLTGKRPFQGDTPVSLLSSIMKDTPPSVTELKERLPHGAGRIVRRCLEKDPGRRYQTAVDLRNDLEDLKREVDSGVILRPAGSPRPAWPRVRTGIAAAIVLAAVVLAVRFARERMGGASAPSPSPPSAGLSVVPITRSGTAVSATISPDGKYVVYVVSEAGKRSLRVRQLATGSEQEILPPSDARISLPKVSPDGAWVYYAVWDHGGTVYRLPILGGHPQRILEHVDGDFDIAPDGDRIAYQIGEGEQARIQVAGIDGSAPRDLVGQTGASVATQVLAWSSDGKSVFFTDNPSQGEVGSVIRRVSVDDGTVSDVGDDVWQLFDLARWPGESGGVLLDGCSGGTTFQVPPQIWRLGPDGQATRLTQGIDAYLSPSLDEAGRTLVAVESRSERSLLVLPGGDEAKARRVAFTSRAGIYWSGVAWTPDGRLLYEDLDGETLQIWIANADGSEPRKITRSGNLNMGPSVSPDGRTVAYFSDRSGEFRVWLSDLDGGNARRLTDDTVAEAFPRFSPDGRWIVYHVFAEDGTAHVCKAPAAGGASIRIADSGTYLPVVSHDGTRIAFVSDESGRMDIVVEDFDTGEILSHIPAELFGGIPLLQWTPDDRGVACRVRTGAAVNVAVYPLDGGPARQITHFTDEDVLGFDWSPDGDSLAVMTSKDSNDVVRITGFRQDAP